MITDSFQLEFVAILGLATVFIMVALYYKFRSPAQQQAKLHRFRKRDKVLFYGRRMLRRMNKIKKKQLLKFTRHREQYPWATIIYKNVSRPTRSTFDSVAVLSHSPEVPLGPFCKELKHAISDMGPTLLLNSDTITQELGPSALDKTREEELSSWLTQQEDNHKIVLYQCDSILTQWTLKCLRQAQCVLIVAMAELEPTVAPLEQKLEHLSVRSQKELILLHKQDANKPKDTSRWLNIRSWCSHHHIRCPPRMFIKKSTRIDNIYNDLSRTLPSNDNDFARLARFLTGTSIGLVLGGGGARGAAHLGMIKAIREAGVPIDMIGGVSIGAFMGALWAQEGDFTRVKQVARNWSFCMTSWWQQILDLTWPATAMFTGAAFNKTIQDVFGDQMFASSPVCSYCGHGGAGANCGPT